MFLQPQAIVSKMRFRLTASQQAYLADQMVKVSRSFALVAPAVEEPLQDYLATAYLICRVVDNIEDCAQPFPWQRQRLAEFSTMLDSPARARSVLASWEQDSWPALTDHESAMMTVDGGHLLWQIYGAIPAEPQAIIARWAHAMAQGMEQVMDPRQNDFFFSRDGVRLPASEEGYDRYCYYVAGTVGHMITELAIDHYSLQGKTAERLLQNSEACGRALQKTNIVKDFPQDLRRGACYLPDTWLRKVDYKPLALAGAPLSWKQSVLENVLSEFENAVTYVLDLPPTAAGFRKASLLMMLPGYQTLLRAARNHDRLFTKSHNIKISRTTMAQCLLDVRSMVEDDEAIAAYGRRMRVKISEALRSPRLADA